MARRDDGHRHASLERRPAATAVVEYEFEHAVAVGNAERCAVEAGLSRDGAESSADVGVEHGEVELEVVQPGVWRPAALGIVPGDVGLECLCKTSAEYLAMSGEDRRTMFSLMV
jgi:hypothetical protein